MSRRYHGLQQSEIQAEREEMIAREEQRLRKAEQKAVEDELRRLEQRALHQVHIQTQQKMQFAP